MSLQGDSNLVECKSLAEMLHPGSVLGYFLSDKDCPSCSATSESNFLHVYVCVCK